MSSCLRISSGLATGTSACSGAGDCGGDSLACLVARLCSICLRRSSTCCLRTSETWSTSTSDLGDCCVSGDNAVARCEGADAAILSFLCLCQASTFFLRASALAAASALASASASPESTVLARGTIWTSSSSSSSAASFAAAASFAIAICLFHSSAFFRRASVAKILSFSEGITSSSSSAGAISAACFSTAASLAAIRLLAISFLISSAFCLWASASTSPSSGARGFLTTSMDASESSSATSSTSSTGALGLGAASASCWSLASSRALMALASTLAFSSLMALIWKKLPIDFTSSLSTFLNSTLLGTGLDQKRSLMEFSAPALLSFPSSGIIAPLALKCR
mmetsp:Transcript_49709/g.106529  ORF Transcript_49709/g.106529 Transcript_49709/m.106529 type:complete len:340 (-) Transcript_49709:496-1515(-)